MELYGSLVEIGFPCYKIVYSPVIDDFFLFSRDNSSYKMYLFPLNSKLAQKRAN